MTTFRYGVTVHAATQEQADQVMCERIDTEEDYGFEYTIDWNREVALSGALQRF